MTQDLFGQPGVPLVVKKMNYVNGSDRPVRLWIRGVDGELFFTMSSVYYGTRGPFSDPQQGELKEKLPIDALVTNLDGAETVIAPTGSDTPIDLKAGASVSFELRLRTLGCSRPEADHWMRGFFPWFRFEGQWKLNAVLSDVSVEHLPTDVGSFPQSEMVDHSVVRSESQIAGDWSRAPVMRLDCQ
jgi:hypothetical protein